VKIVSVKYGNGRIKLSINTAIIVFKIFVLTILGIVIYAWFSPNNTMYKNDDWRTKTGREDCRTKTANKRSELIVRSIKNYK